MLDFTSALYLGMNHPHHSLRPWPALTTGRPAALEPPPTAHALAEDLARLIGCERATLGASTLHIFFDLFEGLAKEGVALFVMLGVQRFRQRLRSAGLAVNGGFFPVQTPSLGRAAAAIHAQLLADGIRTVLHRPREGFPAQVSFLITAAHQFWQIERAADSLAAIVNPGPARARTRRINHEQAAHLQP